MIATLQEAEHNFGAFVKEVLRVVPYGEADETWREVLLDEEMGEVSTAAAHRWGPGAQERIEACFDQYCTRPDPGVEPRQATLGGVDARLFIMVLMTVILVSTIAWVTITK